MSGINLTFSPGTEIQMNFQLGGGGAGGILTAIQFTAVATGTGQSFTSGSLTRYSTSSQALVAVNGVILPLSEYTITGTTITFSVNLNTGDTIIIK